MYDIKTYELKKGLIKVLHSILTFTAKKKIYIYIYISFFPLRTSFFGDILALRSSERKLSQLVHSDRKHTTSLG